MADSLPLHISKSEPTGLKLRPSTLHWPIHGFLSWKSAGSLGGIKVYCPLIRVDFQPSCLTTISLGIQRFSDHLIQPQTEAILNESDIVFPDIGDALRKLDQMAPSDKWLIYDTGLRQYNINDANGGRKADATFLEDEACMPAELISRFKKLCNCMAAQACKEAHENNLAIHTHSAHTSTIDLTRPHSPIFVPQATIGTVIDLTGE
ncbi:hypothetical protein HWV62_39181 [Athelia sp. TMB]|nr:hypothetical protein HWV62_39181 [Athelia sp. TMB]